MNSVECKYIAVITFQAHLVKCFIPDRFLVQFIIRTRQKLIPRRHFWKWFFYIKCAVPFLWRKMVGTVFKIEFQSFFLTKQITLFNENPRGYYSHLCSL